MQPSSDIERPPSLKLPHWRDRTEKRKVGRRGEKSRGKGRRGREEEEKGGEEREEQSREGRRKEKETATILDDFRHVHSHIIQCVFQRHPRQNS